MQLTSHQSDANYQITQYDADKIFVNDTAISCSFIISPKTLEEPWRPRSIQSLQITDMEKILSMSPEIILLGTGSQLIFPEPEIHAQLLAQCPGIEIMDNAAVCRTYNLLTSEDRHVVAGIIL